MWPSLWPGKPGSAEESAWAKVARRFVFTRRQGARKLANFSLVSLQYLLKTTVVRGYPFQLIVDPCNLCQLRCPLCPTGQRQAGRQRGMMSLELFQKIIAEIGPYLYRIDLYNWGEPLLNENLPQMIACAHRARIETRVSTNLNLFDESKAEALIKAGLDYLIVSLHGASQDTYGKYMVGGDFDRAVAGIKIMAQKKRELGSHTPRIVWRFLIFRHNQHEVERVKELAPSLGVDQVDLEPNWGDIGVIPFYTETQRQQLASSWLPDTSKYRFKSLWPCKFLWTGSVINSDGSVSPCCYYYPEEFDFGNIVEAGSFREIWNNEKYRSARAMVRSGRVGGSSGVVCSFCVERHSHPLERQPVSVRS